MDKKLFIFFLLFFLVLSFGCTGGSKEKAKQQNTGSLNATVLVNGVKSNTLSLVSEQNAQIGVNLKNNGVRPLFNVTGRLLGCLTSKDSSVAEILPNTKNYLSWGIKAPTMGEGESITCPTTIRICFDYISKGYTDIVFVPENYSDVPPSPSSTTSSDYFNFNYKFGVNRVINGGNDNTFSGEIYLKNTGSGWVDYVNYTDGLNINMLRSINLTLIGDNLEIVKFGGLNQSTLKNNGWLRNNNKTLYIDSNNVSSYGYLIKLIQGKELFDKMTLNVTDSNVFQHSTYIAGLRTEVNHGYCVDVATIDTHLNGR